MNGTRKPRTPSMDDKATPSPPTRTSEQYEADKRSGINPIATPPVFEEGGKGWPEQ